MNKNLKDLISVSREFGRNPEFVIAGGGNTSWKEKELIYIKASGVSLADIDENGFCILSREKLARIPLLSLPEEPLLREEIIKEALLDSRVDLTSGLRPSVETSLHDLFEYTFVVHTHPTLVNGLMCSMGAESETAALFGNQALYIPYSDPGFVLFTIIRGKILDYRLQNGSDPKMVFIQNHGVFVAADSVEEIRELYQKILSSIRNAAPDLPATGELKVSSLMNSVLPAVRMLLSSEKPRIARAFNNESVAPFLTDEAAFSQAAHPFTPDQVVYCLSEYLFVSHGEPEEVIGEIREGIQRFREKKGSVPKVIFIKDEGVIVSEDNAVNTGYVEALVLDFTRIAYISRNFGGPHPMTPRQVAFIENWEVENYRKKVSLGGKLKGRAENRIVLITGAAQGFGAGIAEMMFEEGANVVISDLNEEKGADFAAELNRRNHKNRAFFVKVNVSDAASVKRMIEETVLHFGGLDVMISNAGILKAGGLEDMTPENFDLMTRVNYNAYFYCAKYASEVMKIQYKYHPGMFMDIIQINSKSGLKGSKKNFAYAGGKFGGIGLTQSFALELMPFHIKVNAICPGNFFDGPLWSDPRNGLFVQYLNAGKIPGAKTIEDVKRYYEGQVPAGRGCLPSDVVKAIFYIIDQEYETGQAIPVTGGQEMLN